MLHGRYMNLPLKLITPLHTNLMEDFRWAQTQESAAASVTSASSCASESASSTGVFSKIELILLVAPCSRQGTKCILIITSTSYRSNSSVFGTKLHFHFTYHLTQRITRVITGSSASSADVTGDSTLLFHNFEDEIFCQESVATVIFTPSTSSSSHVAAVIPLSSFDTCLSALSKMLD